MKWIDAIIEVLQKSDVAMSSEDLAIIISKSEKITTFKSTPDAAVIAVIEQNAGIFENNIGRTIQLKKTFNYIEWNKTNNITEAEENKYIKECIEKKTKKIIRTYGVYWKRDSVDWNGSALMGRQLNGQPVDFGEIRGIYILYDNREPIFVGQAISVGLLNKLKTHTQDRLANRWNRFSWFGIYGVNQSGSIHKVNTFSFAKINDIADALEAILVEGLEPRQYRDNYAYFNGAEYSQYE